MRRPTAKLCHAVLAAGIVAFISSAASAQVATLGAGHQLLVNKGLQIWGLDQGAVGFNYNNLANANFNGVLWSFGIDVDNSKLASMSAGQKWGKWLDANGTPATALDAFETSRIADLVALQVGDEQQSDIEDPNGNTKAWFQAAHAGNHFPNQLKYVNSFFINSDNAYATFIANANPDAISFDSYPFDEPYGSVILPHNWLSKAGHFRRHALSSHLGIGGNAPRPYGMYLQTYAATEGPGMATRHPGEVEMRWQQFTAWTMGFTFVDAFTVGGSSSLFSGSNMSSPTEPRYSQFAETSRQSLNLGPALTRLISYGYGPSIVRGKDSAGTTNILPSDWLDFNKVNAPPNQQYLTSISAANIGTKNNGQPGDVYVGFFNPLHESFGDPAGTAYFMVTNALGPYLNDPTATVADCMQQITLDFDFGATTINSLQRLSRDTGLVEVVPLTHLMDNKYRLMFNLEGGTGDLFKFNDGTPFVGIQAPEPTLYWDPDGNAANNNLTTGAGLGGFAFWDNSNQWFDGTAAVPWSSNDHAVFWGTGDIVYLNGPKSVSSLTFKSNGYTVTGAALTLSGPHVTVDAGMAATIASNIAGSAGLVKNGAGTLILNGNKTYTGGTTVNEGILAIVSLPDVLGALPSAPTINIAINNGAQLRLLGSQTLHVNRRIVLGSGGGAIETFGSDSAIDGVISGGTLNKVGNGTLTLKAINTHSGTTVSGGALQVSGDGPLGAAPASFTAGNITLDGGTLRFGDNFSIHNNRGITLGAAGGTIDTQGFNNGVAGYNAFQGGFRGTGDLTKLGSGTFFASATTTGANVNWKGRLIIKEGTWKINATDGLPYNVIAADPLQPGQVTLDGGTWQIAANMNVTNGKRGVTIAAGGGTVDTQSFNLTWAGPWAGSVSTAVLNKIGPGTLRLNSNAAFGPGTYAGILNVNGGTLQLDGGTAMGNLAAINLANTAGVVLNVTGSVSETVGSLAGGGSAGGNITLNVGITTGGNNNSTTVSGLVSGAGGITKNGSGTFTLARSAGNSYTGLTTINAGTLLVNNATGSGTGSNFVIVNSGGTLGGTGAVSGEVEVRSGAHIAPGSSIESLGVGSLTLRSGSILDFELDTLLGVDTSDLINVTGNLTIDGGTLNLTDAGAMTDGTYMLIDYAGSLSGSVGNITLGATPAGFTYNLIHNTTNSSIDLVVSLAGDFNGDGTVDAADYVVWRKGLGTTYTMDDLDTWRAHFGESSSGGGSNAVPEPTSWLLVSLGIPALLCRHVYRKTSSIRELQAGR